MLYKYRSIQNFKFFVDIILNQRLYAATYKDMNDPMEGHYVYNSGDLNFNIREKLNDAKGNIRICSLSRSPNNDLLWAHYADGHKGLVIGLEVNRNIYNVRPIIYDGLPEISNRNFNNDSATEILSHKLNLWEYEEEERVFVSNSNYIDVSINKIILGSRMSTRDISFVTKLTNRLDPNIEIERNQ